MKPLPVIISIPHSGIAIPKSLEASFLLNNLDVLYDGDSWTNLIYNFEKRVLHTALMPIARSVIDLNRMEVDLPPDNADGLIKTKSIMAKPVWRRPLSIMEIQSLISLYYTPYYEGLEQTVKIEKPLLGLDCHSMLPHDPFDASKKKRPLICISNRGGLQGENLNETITAPQDLMLQVKSALEMQFGKGSVTLNNPFKGGEVIRKMHEKTNIPWIQLEINRCLYMPKDLPLHEYPDEITLHKIQKINAQLYKALESLFFNNEPTPYSMQNQKSKHANQ